MMIIERLIFVIVFIVTIPLFLLWFVIPTFGGIFIGMPIAGIKFILTGSSGIDWYMDNVMDFAAIKQPMFLWMDSIERRSKKEVRA